MFLLQTIEIIETVLHFGGVNRSLPVPVSVPVSVSVSVSGSVSVSVSVSGLLMDSGTHASKTLFLETRFPFLAKTGLF